MASTEGEKRVKLIKRGIVTNSLAGVILGGVAYGLDLGLYSTIAAGMQLAVFLLHGLPYRSEKYYDLSGSFTHFALVATSLMAATIVRSPRQIACALGSVVWMTRLGSFLFTRISRDGKDGRFDALKTVWLSFMGAWGLQAAWVLLIQLPVVLVNSQLDHVPLNPVDVVAMLVWVSGFLIEGIADAQKFKFRGIIANKDKFITDGLWAYSRHPNYFGEIMMWSAMALSASYSGYLVGNTRLYWAWGSPAFTSFLLLKVSGVPLVERAGKKKWGDNTTYKAYMKGTSLLVPWFPAKLD